MANCNHVAFSRSKDFQSVKVKIVAIGTSEQGDDVYSFTLKVVANKVRNKL